MCKKILNFLVLVMLFSGGSILAQNKTISGTITDENNVPLPGANVILKGTSTGVSSDFDGKYSIDVPNDSVLMYSMLGFTTQEVSTSGQTTINVALKEAVSELNEVVVTALGIRRERKALSYAIQEVKSEELSRVSNGNVASSLQGKVAGLNISSTGGVGGEARIDLRGFGSLSGNDRLLWVVDGVPFGDGDTDTKDPTDLFGGTTNGGGLLDINPDNIEAISVLKGGPAAALYGSRGANGVVLVTTKSGKNSKGLGISYTGSTTFSDASYFLDLQNEYGQGRLGVYDETVGTSWGPRFDGVDRIAWTGETLPYEANPNQLEDFVKTGVSVRNSLTFTNANDKGNYLVSIAKDNREGVYKNNEIDKLNFDVKAAYDINPWLNIDTKVSYINTKGAQRPEIGRYSYISFLNSMPANIRTQDLAPGFVTVDNETREILFGPSSVLTENPNANARNPYFIQDQIDNSDKRNRYFGYFAANVSITENLKLRLKYGLDYYRYKTVNGYRFPDNASDQRPNYNITETSFSEENFEFLLSYNKNLNEDFKLGFSFGGNRMVQGKEFLDVRSGRINSEETFFLNAGQQVTAVEDFTEKEIQSLYGLGELSYKSMLFLTVTGRNDWSSALPIDNNSYFYPSVGLSALVSEMTELPDWMNYLKVRGSWSQIGKDAEAEKVNPVIKLRPWNFGLTVSDIFKDGVSPLIEPEISTTTEFGLETRLFDNRLRLDFTYYNEQTKNQIISLEPDQAIGFENIVKNVGLVSNKGVEILANVTPIKTEDFKLGVTLNFAKNVGKLEELETSEDDDEIYFFFDSNTIPEEVRATEGEKLGDIYGFAYNRDDNGNLIVGADGLPTTTSEKKALGNIQADFTGSIGIDINYKNFYLSSLFAMQQGGDIYSLTEASATASGRSAKSVSLGREPFFVDGGVFADGSTNTQIVSPQEYWRAVSGITEEFIYDASYMKLSELAVGYNFPKSILSKLGNGVIESARLSVIGRNLFYLYRNTPGTVPDAGVYNTTVGGLAFDYSPVPVSRSLGFSLNLKF